MKKSYLIAAVAALALCSCSSLTKTAHYEDVNTALNSRATADLKVNQTKITYTMKPSKAIQKGGLKNCKEAVVAEALAQNGGDILVAPQFEYNIKSGKVTYITVTGYPATYTNVHPTTVSEAEVISILGGKRK